MQTKIGDVDSFRESQSYFDFVTLLNLCLSKQASNVIKVSSNQVL